MTLSVQSSHFPGHRSSRTPIQISLNHQSLTSPLRQYIVITVINGHQASTFVEHSYTLKRDLGLRGVSVCLSVCLSQAGTM